MSLHATFRGGPADGTERIYPHIATALLGLWWIETSGPAHHQILRGQDGRSVLASPDTGAAYRLVGEHPERPEVWIYTVVELRGLAGPTRP